MNQNMLNALKALIEDRKADGRSVAGLRKRGYVDEEGAVTKEGRVAYLDNVPTELLYTLTLGEPLSGVKDKEGKRYTLPKGTRLIAIFAGRSKDRYKQRWYDCFLAEKFPTSCVLWNKKHKLETTRVPKNIDEEMQE